MKPLDTEMLAALASESNLLITVEEGSRGGFGAHVMHFLTDEGLLDGGNCSFRSMCVPDVWIGSYDLT
jgi:1-deoxy-D-xylulose-5-phosphate synthase